MRGQSTVIGALIMFAFAVIGLSALQATWVPNQVEEAESIHSQEVSDQLIRTQDAALSRSSWRETLNDRPSYPQLPIGWTGAPPQATVSWEPATIEVDGESIQSGFVTVQTDYREYTDVTHWLGPVEVVSQYQNGQIVRSDTLGQSISLVQIPSPQQNRISGTGYETVCDTGVNTVTIPTRTPEEWDGSGNEWTIESTSDSSITITGLTDVTVCVSGPDADSIDGGFGDGAGDGGDGISQADDCKDGVIDGNAGGGDNQGQTPSPECQTPTPSDSSDSGSGTGGENTPTPTLTPTPTPEPDCTGPPWTRPPACETQSIRGE